jgi:hypothetical protein
LLCAMRRLRISARRPLTVSTNTRTTFVWVSAEFRFGSTNAPLPMRPARPTQIGRCSRSAPRMASASGPARNPHQHPIVGDQDPAEPEHERCEVDEQRRSVEDWVTSHDVQCDVLNSVNPSDSDGCRRDAPEVLSHDQQHPDGRDHENRASDADRKRPYRDSVPVPNTVDHLDGPQRGLRA